MGSGVTKAEIDGYLSRQELLLHALQGYQQRSAHVPPVDERVVAVAAKSGGGDGGGSDGNPPPRPTAQEGGCGLWQTGHKPSLPPPPFIDDEHAVRNIISSPSANQFRPEPPVSPEEHAVTLAQNGAAISTNHPPQHPFLSVIAPSMNFTFGAKDSAPALTASVDYVYGITTLGVRQHFLSATLSKTGHRAVVFPAERLVVVQDVHTNDQAFITAHCQQQQHDQGGGGGGSDAGAPNGAVSCLARHPLSKERFISADCGSSRSTVAVWDVGTGRSQVMHGLHPRGASFVALAATSPLAASIGLDDDQAFLITRYDIDRNHAEQTPAPPVVILGKEYLDVRITQLVGNIEVTTMDQYPFITVGYKHIAFWTLLGGGGSDSCKLSAVHPDFSPDATSGQTFVSVASCANFTAVGGQTGEVFLFSNLQHLATVDAHTSCVLSMSLSEAGDCLLTGGEDGFLHVWSVDLQSGYTAKRRGLFNADTLSDARNTKAHDDHTQGSSSSSSSRRVSNQPDATHVLSTDLWSTSTGGVVTAAIALNHGVAALVGFDTAKGTVSTRPILTAHPTARKQRPTTDMSFSLTVSPDGAVFISTSGKLGMVWDRRARRRLKAFYLPSTCRAATWSPDGRFVAFGLENGSVQLLEYFPVSKTAEIHTFIPVVCQGSVRCLAFSPDSTLLAIGGNNNSGSGSGESAVFLYEISNGAPSLGVVMPTHSGTLLNMDFNDTGQLLQVTTLAHELIHFDVSTLSLIQPAALARERVRNVVWFTQSCRLGWAVQGIWPRTGSHIITTKPLCGVNMVCKSSDKQYLATSEENGTVKIFHFQCVGGGCNAEGKLVSRPAAVRLFAHAMSATSCAWTERDTILLTAGAACVISWRITPANTSS